jgi:hypothetical protein
MAPTISTEARNGETSPPRSHFRSWLKPKRSDERDSASFDSAKNAISSDWDLSITAPVEDTLKPVSFFGLFRSVIATLLSLVYN